MMALISAPLILSGLATSTLLLLRNSITKKIHILHLLSQLKLIPSILKKTFLFFQNALKYFVSDFNPLQPSVTFLYEL